MAQRERGRERKKESFNKIVDAFEFDSPSLGGGVEKKKGRKKKMRAILSAGIIAGSAPSGHALFSFVFSFSQGVGRRGRSHRPVEQ
ncbi:hypothetical protein CEXT_551431 [Caerostris extrusa]|uniref:Uncharacterized protein n=1 Tax=Caerostris extrusa TaxID=172846 RepID=A0AAV4UPE1_CAEEX|nr:hypothetical protein CEXT_551431 [Caerostris extrusa]